MYEDLILSEECFGAVGGMSGALRYHGGGKSGIKSDSSSNTRHTHNIPQQKVQYSKERQNEIKKYKKNICPYCNTKDKDIKTCDFCPYCGRGLHMIRYLSQEDYSDLILSSESTIEMKDEDYYKYCEKCKSKYPNIKENIYCEYCGKKLIKREKDWAIISANQKKRFKKHVWDT